MSYWLLSLATVRVAVIGTNVGLDQSKEYLAVCHQLDGTVLVREWRQGVSERIRWIGLAVFLGLCIGAGGLGAIATTPEIDGWYKIVAKPTWNPPNYVFGPVWTTLFVMMAIAAWLAWRPAGFKAAKVPLLWFAVQLALNVAWSWIFFGLHQPGWAFVEIVILWLAIAATTRAFFQRSKLAGWLLVPYLVWVSFATVLNFAIWRLN